MNDTTKALITLKLLTLISQGVPVRTAIDSVLGAGTSARVIGEVYDALRSGKEG